VANLYWLNQIRPEYRASVGLKAFYLSHLQQKGYPVVPGFVVSALTLQTFLESMDWTEPLFADLPGSSLHIDIDNSQQLQAIARQLRQAIAAAPLPNSLLQELEVATAHFQLATLILRPSLSLDPLAQRSEDSQLTTLALKSAGLLTSQVCRSDLESLAQGLKQVWGELFSAKSLFYWQRHSIPLQQLRLAVLVQPMQPAIASGTICATETRLDIYSTIGLGIALARGEVVPDYDLVDSVTGSIQSRKLGQKSIAYRLTNPSHLQSEIAPPSSEPAISHSAASWLPPLNRAAALQNPLHLTEVPSLVETYLLTDQQRTEFTLAESDIQALVGLAQMALADGHTLFELEWILLPELVDHSRLYLTQFIPQTTPISPVSKSHSLPPSKRSSKTVEIFPGATLIATGLSVASGQAIARASVITDTHTFPNEFAPHTILVAPTLPLDWLPLIEQSAALISEQGGMTSHSAIIARELGVPAVTGVPAITQQIRSGELLWVDGDRGKIYRLNQLSADIANVGHDAHSETRPSTSRQQPRLTTTLMVNVSQPNQVLKAANLPVSGVGLLRAELLALSVLDNQHPFRWLEQQRKNELVERMTEAIARFAEAFDPRPVFYRSFDFRFHEFQDFHCTSPSPTTHSVLGMRGAFSYRVDPTLFKLELACLAILQQAGHTNVHLLLPFVRTVEEFVFCRHLVEQAGLTRTSNFQLWIMAEVPSVLLLLPDYVEAGVQGISIGTNDLTQLLLGVDRDNADLASVFEERHPVVKRAIARLIQEARQLGIPCSICGEAPVRYPDLIADLVHWGIQSISVAPDAVESTYWELVRVEQALGLASLRAP